MQPIVLPLLERSVRRKLQKSGVKTSHVATPVGRVHVYDAPGTRPPVVLLHGISSAAAPFAPVIARLRGRGHRVLAIDLPGHGFSDAPSVTLTPDALFDAMIGVLDGLASEPYTLVGNSLGGAVALRYAIARPDRVASLVLLSPAGAASSDDELAQLKDSFHIDSRRDALDFVARVAHRPRPLIRLLAHELVGATKRPAVRDLLATTTTAHGATPADVAALPMPILLWWGRSERLLPASHLAWWRDHLPKHAVIEEPEGIGHCPHMDAPGRVAERIASFAT